MKKKLLSNTFLIAIIISGLFLVSSVHFDSAQASTVINGGVISSDTTWTTGNSPVVVTGNIRVDEGATLTIEPGVTVTFTGNYYFEIRGALVASGTSANYITFTSNLTSPLLGSWVGIRNWAYEAQSSPYVRSKGNITINYCIVEYAATGVQGWLENDGSGNIASVIISNCKLVNNNRGIYLSCREYSNSYAHISNNIILYNGEGISIENRYSSPTLIVEDNTIALNRGNGLSIGGMPYPGDTLVRRNVITKNGGTGISIAGGHTHSHADIILTENLVTFNQIGVSVTLSPLYTATLAIANIYENDLYSNTQYDLKVGTPNTYPQNINATFNYWGTTNSTLINQHIYDGNDNWELNLAKADYTPVLQNPLESRSPGFFEIHAPIVSVSPTSWIMHVGQSKTFTATAYSGSGVYSSYQWYVGRVAQSNQTTSTFNFAPASAGSYSITVTVTDSLGATSTQSSGAAVTITKSTYLSISVDASSVTVGSAVNIKGSLLDLFGNSLQTKTVTLSYTVAGSTSWIPISSGTTNTAGEYNIQWVNTASGTFTLKAEWIGNADYLGASNTTSISFLPFENQNVFFVESNSTVTALAFNSTSSELSFAVGGTSGTTGYVKVTIAKSLVQNPENIKVYLDVNQLTYQITSNTNAWLLTFNYPHSTHNVSIDLGIVPASTPTPTPEPTPTQKEDSPIDIVLIGTGGGIIVLLAIIAIFFSRRK